MLLLVLKKARDYNPGRTRRGLGPLMVIQLLKNSHLVFPPNFTLLFKILDEMSEYWLISVPGDVKEGHPSWDMLKSKIGALSNIWRFHIPADLKVRSVNLF